MIKINLVTIKITIKIIMVKVCLVLPLILRQKTTIITKTITTIIDNTR